MANWFQLLTWFDFLGLVGVFLYIGSYFGLQAGLIKGQGYFYASLNAIAAACLLLSLIQNFNLSSAIVEITYILISIFGMLRFYILSHQINFNEEEKILIQGIAPNLSNLDARKLIDLGIWNTATSGTLLTEEGRSPENFYFLLDGEAKVAVSGNEVARLGPGSIVGELSWLTGMEASAYVCLTKQSRLFAIGVTKLNECLKRNPNIQQALHASFAIEVSKKLVFTTAALSAKE